jgi:hypothetical protein
MMDIEAFLRTFGNQKVQISVSFGGKPFIYYVMKTTKTTVEYLDVCEKPHNDATLTINIDTSDIHQKKSKVILRTLFNLTKRGQMSTLIRGVIAGLVNHLAVTKSAKPSGPMTLPPEYYKTGCRLDGWDKDAYLQAKFSK